jgi:hypothetical protein
VNQQNNITATSEFFNRIQLRPDVQRIAAAIAQGLRWLPSGFGQTNQANIVMDETGAATAFQHS